MLRGAGSGLKASTIAAFVLSLLVQVGFPLAVTLYYRSRTRARWQIYGYGAVMFAVFQLFTWLPLSVYLDTTLGAAFTSELWAFIWLMTMALTTSLVEESGRWLGYRYLFPRGLYRLTWTNGVMYGLGHGSLETLLFFAGLTFVYFVAYLILGNLNLSAVAQPLGVGPSSSFIAALSDIANTSWEQPIVVAVERILALPHQIAWSLLVMESVILRQKRWFGFAILFHTSVAVIVPGLVRLAGFLVAEVINALFATLSLWIILKLRTVSEATG